MGSRWALPLFLLLLQVEFSFAFSAVIPENTQATAVRFEARLQKAQQLHDQECEDGFQTFGKPSTVTSKEMWNDEHFQSFSVGKGNAGPDEYILENGDKIFQSKEPVFDARTCQELIDEARDTITRGLKEDEGRHDSSRPTNSELGEAKMSSLLMGKKWLKKHLHETLFPLLESRFGLSAGSLTLNDALIIGYGYFGGPTRSQPIHRDASVLSLNIALSPIENYEGGGTYFQGIDSILKQEQGHVMCHSGGAMHAGNGITAGERWILVLFVVSEDVPQLSRRCHLMGLEEPDNTEAREIFEAGLSVAPNDHLIYTDLGRTYMKEGKNRKARECLSKSADVYSLDGKAAIGLAKMLQENRRPRAALRILEKVLVQVGDSDLKPDAWVPLRAMAWDARVTAISCALQCANKSRDFANQNLIKTVQRLRVAASISPGNPQIGGMMQFAEKLMIDYAIKE